MAQTPNLVTQTNPFLGNSGQSGLISPQIISTPSTAPTSGGQNFAGVPYGSGAPSSTIPGLVPIAGTGGTSINNAPKSTPVVNSSPISNPGLNTSLNAIPGETYAQYEARVGGQSSTPQSTVSQSNNGSGSGVYSNPAPSFSGLVGGLANTSSGPTQNFTQNNNTSQQAQTGLINSVPTNSANVENATNNLQALENNYADQNSIIGNSPIGLSEQGGEQGILNSQYASKLSNAQGALTNALTGNAQTQTAYNEAGGLANSAASNATAQQGTQQSGQASAAGLAQPQPANALGTYNPTTGQYEQYGGGQGGGAAEAGAVGTQVQQGAAVQSMTGIYNQAQGLSSSLTQAINSSGYNPASGVGPATTYANGVNQWLQTNSGNPQYQNVANLISEVANKYAAILNQSGGTPTSVSQVQQQIINGLASGQQIEQVLGSLSQNAQTSINALNNSSQTNSAAGTTLFNS